MEIKINNKSHKIKFASQLTAGEYIKYMESLSDTRGSYEQLINYIAIVTGMTCKDTSMVDIDDNSIRRLSTWIGNVPQINEIPELDRFYYKRKGRTIYRGTLNWRTLGARKMLEEKGMENSMEQAVYLLAVYVSGDYDNEKVERIYNELLDYDAMDVFGFIVFFFKKLTIGMKPGRTCWLMHKIRAFINTQRSSKR